MIAYLPIECIVLPLAISFLFKSTCIFDFHVKYLYLYLTEVLLNVLVPMTGSHHRYTRR